MASIEEVFADLIAKHDLTVINVGLRSNPVDVSYAWTAWAHWDGFSADGNRCATGDGPTAELAIENAISGANAKRFPVAGEIDQIELAA